MKKKVKNTFLVKNDFKMYRHEVPNIYKQFYFLPANEPIILRTDPNEEGYDDITEYIPANKLTSIFGFKPFIENFEEEFFIDNYTKMSFNDCKLTQTWALGNLSQELFLKLSIYEEPIKKIEEKDFLTLLNDKFEVVNLPREITIDDIGSLDVEFLYLYNRSFNNIELLVHNTKFQNDLNVIENDTLDLKPNLSLYVPRDIIEFYYGLPRTKEMVYTALQMEYLLSPAIVFEYDLYLRLKDKINYVYYDCSMET